MADSVSRSWFCVFNNPAEHGYEGTPEEVCNRLRDEWCTRDYPFRTGAWVYCVSAAGLHHIHMVLEDNKPMRFSMVKASYAIGMHFEPTRGSKSQVEDYINKRGKFEEKGEVVLFTLCHGDLIGHQGRRSDLENIAAFIADGMRPGEILEFNPRFYRSEPLIRKMYFDKRIKETPLIRPVTVIWHMGYAGSGKSYSRIKLSAERGEENIYYLTDYSNAAFDGYSGQEILWMEDFKGEFSYGYFLRLLDVYKADLHCRYTNSKALWTEVHITSIYHPKKAYMHMVSNWEQKDDTVDQLLRRINCIRYHMKVWGDYYEMDFSPDTDVQTMRFLVQKSVPFEEI